MRLLKAFSSGYFSLPMKIMCSRKCANPYLLAGSLKLPAFIAIETEAIFPPASFLAFEFKS
jgi:hypothetical protein